jgi:glutathione S-transferase
MAEFVLFHGNKNYSSWSMRAWLALKASGVDFDEVAFHLGEPGVRERIRRHSPTGRVPALRHGDLTIWDSLAIGEYLAERAPDAGLWPASREERAVARSVCAEMHSGFQALRTHMPFNVRRSSPGKGRAPGVQDDIERIAQIWVSCREKQGADGPFLFGRYGLADVFFAPVVTRFQTYAVELDGVSNAYASAILEHADVADWYRAARAEEWVESEYDL